MTINKRFTGAAALTSADNSMSPTAPGVNDTFLVASGAGYPNNGRFVIKISRGKPDEEKILILSASGNIFTVEQRGYDGTVAVAHAAGASVELALDADTIIQLVDHVDVTTADDHSQYMMTSGTRHDLAARHPIGTVIATGLPGAISPDDSVSEGVATSVARSDHRHPITAATASASAVGDVAAEGVATSFARSDHAHGREAFAAPVSVTTAIAAGVATTVPRSDHAHDLAAGVVVEAKIADGAVSRAKRKAEVWTDFTPVFTNLALGDGTVVSRYEQVGKTIRWYGQIVFGSTTSISGDVGMTIPVAAFSGPLRFVGGAWFENANVLSYVGTVSIVVSTGKLGFLVADNHGAMHATNPFAWGTSDAVYWSIQYEAA